MFETIWLFKSHLQWLLLLVFVLLALWRGAGPERQSALVFIGMFAFDRFYHLLFGRGEFFLGADLGHILIDSIALVAFVLIALRANRVYPIWLASFQLLTIVSHVVRAISPAIEHGAYAILVHAPSYLEVAVFGLGTLLHIKRQAKYGPYRSWQNS